MANGAKKYPSIAPSWRRAVARVHPVFAFPPSSAQIIYTTNAIESLNRVQSEKPQIRAVAFPMLMMLRHKLNLFLAIRSFEKTGRGRQRKWVAARNQFAIPIPKNGSTNEPAKTRMGRPHTQKFRDTPPGGRVLGAVDYTPTPIPAHAGRTSLPYKQSCRRAATWLNGLRWIILTLVGRCGPRNAQCPRSQMASGTVPAVGERATEQRSKTSGAIVHRGADYHRATIQSRKA